MVLQDSEAAFHPNVTLFTEMGDNFPPCSPHCVVASSWSQAGRGRHSTSSNWTRGKQNTSFCQFMKTNSDAVNRLPEVTIVGNGAKDVLEIRVAAPGPGESTAVCSHAVCWQLCTKAPLTQVWTERSASQKEGKLRTVREAGQVTRRRRERNTSSFLRCPHSFIPPTSLASSAETESLYFQKEVPCCRRRKV